MTILRSTMSRKSSRTTGFIRRCLVAGIFACLAAIAALAQTENIVVTLLPSYADTEDTQSKGYLNVTHSESGFNESKSWLYFDASALPAGIKEEDFESVQLQLVPKEGAPREMAITVAPASGSTAKAGYAAVDAANASTLESDLLPKNKDELELRSDFASLPRAGLLKSKPDGSRYIGLVLLPQPNASRRVYYGLTTQNKDDPKDTYDHPDRLPRLIITYRRPPPPYSASACSSEPSALALSQSDGRQADTSPCPFMPTLNNPAPAPDDPAKSVYVLLQVAPGTRTRTPVVYGNRIYVVRGDESQSRLEELGPLGDIIASLPLVVVDGKGEKRFLKVAPDSLMVVDRFGRLRIITNDAILTAQLGTGGSLPASVEESKFAFGAVPDTVVPGPDGTLYIVKQSIFALNPKVEKLGANGELVPEKLWDVAIENPESARITLSPDGRFLYALTRLADKYSGFVAINAQSGKDVQLLAGKVNTSGTIVTWVSGLKFDKAGVTEGQRIPIGRGENTKFCTVQAVQTKSPQSLTCKEDIGKHTEVPWADFPEYLTSFRNPVVARGLHEVDYIYIAGNLGEKTTLWGVRNEPGPVPRDRDYLARLTAEWKYNPGENSSVGQPILDPTPAPADTGLSQKRLYFLQKGGGGEPKLVALKALDGTLAAQPATPPRLPAKISTEGNPVVDSDKDVILWADNTLYGFAADTGPLFTAQPEMSRVPQLLFGPGGTLYAAYGPPGSVSTVSALVPSFTLNAGSPTDICSPTHLQVTGTATAGQQWQLSARGSVILGNGFVVQSGAQLKVKVNVSQCPGG